MGIGRSRLSVAISRDDGDTWENFKNSDAMDDRTRIEPPPLGEVKLDPSEALSIEQRTRTAKERPQRDFTPYPYAGNSKDYQAYLVSEYPSITFLSDDRVAISYNALGGPWNLEGPRSEFGEGHWINESNLPGLVVQVIPLSWFYE